MKSQKRHTGHFKRDSYGMEQVITVIPFAKSTVFHFRQCRKTLQAVLDAEVRIGELMAQIPKVRINNPTGKNQHTGQNDTVVDLSKTENLVEIVTSQPRKTKEEIIKETGFTQKQAERFQTLAKYPEIVEQVKAEARENDDIVSRSAVLNKIKLEEKKETILKAENKIVEQAKEEYKPVETRQEITKAAYRKKSTAI